MRIGYLVPEFPGQTHAFFWREAAAMREAGHEVHLLSTRRPARNASKHQFASAARRETHYLWPPISFATLRTSVSTLTAREGPTVRYLRACSATEQRERLKLTALAVSAVDLARYTQDNKLDHVHVHSCADAAHLGAMQHRLTQVPYSLTLHGDLAVYGNNHGLKMADARFVSAVTIPLQRQVVDLMGWPEGKVPVIQMGVDAKRFSSERALQPRTPGGSVTLLTVARLYNTKGHLYALRAVKQLRDEGVAIKYVIAGEGPERKNLDSEILRLGLTDSVEMPGTVSEDGVIELLRSADIFVLPSFGLGEAAPVSVMEAMASGCATVATAIGAIPDMIDDGRTGFVVPQKDSGALASVISRLARDPALRDQIGVRARAHAAQAFDYRENAHRQVAGMAR